VGDFGCYYAQRARFLVENKEQRQAYMCAQIRSAYEEGQYDPYKADIFALGLILLEMATLALPLVLNPAAEFSEEIIRRKLIKLRVSRDFKELLRAMLSPIECKRPHITEVQSIAKELTVKSQQQLLMLEEERRRLSIVGAVQEPLVYVEPSCVKVFDFPKKVWDTVPLVSPVMVDEGSRYVWVSGRLFCSGGKGEGRGRNDAYLLDREGAVVKLADMMIPRYGHGLWWHCARQSVLTFGGKLYIGTSKI
jgi:serine/threonine protein kinase